MKRFIVITTLFTFLSLFIARQNAAIDHNLQVTAGVDPTVSDFSIAITADKVEGDEIYTDEIISFQVNYAAVPITGFPMEIVVSWEQGLVEGSGSNYVDVYDYVINSATNSPDGTVPVIDLLNNTITWTIPQVSASVDTQILYFDLQVKSSFLTTNRILVYTNVDATYQNAVHPQESIYFYVNPAITATPTPTSSPTPSGPTPTVPTAPPEPTDTPTPTGPTPTFTITPTPTETPTNTPAESPIPTITPPTDTPPPTVTPSPTLTFTPVPTFTSTLTPTGTLSPTLSPARSVTPSLSHTPTVSPSISIKPTPVPTFKEFKFEKVSIEHIGEDNAIFTSTTSLDATLIVEYDLCSSKEFTNQIVYENNNRYHEIVFENLASETAYCFKIVATNSLIEKTIESDVFIFRTAKEGTSYRVLTTRTLWNSLQLNAKTSKRLVVPDDIPVVLTVEMDNPENIKEIEGEFVSRSVLGASTMARSNVQQVKFAEVAPGTFSAEIATPEIMDNYFFTLEITDKLGKFSKTITPYSFLVSNPLQILDDRGKPVEAAYVQIERYEESREQFYPFNSAFSLSTTGRGFFLPFYTDDEGLLNIALPIGKYRATATAIGYATAQQEFSLGEETQSYPVVKMKSEFTFATLISYLKFSISTVYQTLFSDADSYFSTKLLITFGLFFQVIMVSVLILFGLGKVGVIDRIHTRLGAFLKDFERELFELFMGIWSIMNIIVSILFMIFQGIEAALPFIIITVIVTVVDITLFLLKEKNLLKIKDLISDGINKQKD